MTTSKVFGLICALALASISTGCTMGVVVDDNFNQVQTAYSTTTGLGTAGASVTFFGLDANNNYTGSNYTFNFNGQPYLSFDPYADQNANLGNPSLQNQKQFLPPGHYYASYFQPQMGFARSNNFDHEYGAACQDPYTKGNDAECAQYFLQLSTSPYCRACHGPGCGTPDLAQHNGMKVITMCVPFF
jgi:hypothetical protein